MTTRLQLLEAVAEAARQWLGDRGPALGSHDALRDALKALDAYVPPTPLSQENQDSRRTFPRGYYGEGDVTMGPLPEPTSAEIKQVAKTMWEAVYPGPTDTTPCMCPTCQAGVTYHVTVDQTIPGVNAPLNEPPGVWWRLKKGAGRFFAVRQQYDAKGRLHTDPVSPESRATEAEARADGEASGLPEWRKP